MGIIVGEEIGRYDPYTDKFIKAITPDRIEIGTDGNLYRLSVSNGNEYLPKDRLYTKAEMVAMLTEIQLELEEIETYENTFGSELRPKKANEIQKECLDLIQQKINTLNADRSDKE